MAKKSPTPSPSDGFRWRKPFLTAEGRVWLYAGYGAYTLHDVGSAEERHWRAEYAKDARLMKIHAESLLMKLIVKERFGIDIR